MIDNGMFGYDGWHGFAEGKADVTEHHVELIGAVVDPERTSTLTVRGQSGIVSILTAKASGKNTLQTFDAAGRPGPAQGYEARGFELG